MTSRGARLLVLMTAILLAVAPVMADDHMNETEHDEPDDDSDHDIDGTDNSTELVILEPEAHEKALAVLSDNEWELENSSTHEEDGYYEFRFTISGEEAEAEVKVDGSSGEVFEHEEELEKEDKEGEHEDEEEEHEVEELEKVEVENMHEARERITELRTMVMDLRTKVAKLRGQGAHPHQTDDRDEVKTGGPGDADPRTDRPWRVPGQDRQKEEVEVEMENESGETEVEVEREGPGREARDNVNGTPGSEKARQKRPGFVNRLLGGIFN